MYNEARTRNQIIDPKLLKAGWNVSDMNQVGTEIPVDGFDPLAWQQLEKQGSPVFNGKQGQKRPKHVSERN